MTTTRRPKAAKREIPAHWQVLMARKGLNSIRALAMKANLDHMTTTRVVFGDKEASERVIQAIAGALDLDMGTAYRLMGQPAKYVEPWTPPVEAARMTVEQRRVVEDLIRVLVDGGRPVSAPSHEDVEDVHPERDNLGLAADKSHGISQWQQWEDEDDDVNNV